MPFLFVFLLASLTYGTTHVVSTGTANIQAIADSALPDDILLFETGTHTVNLHLTKRLILMGAPNTIVTFVPQRDSLRIICVESNQPGSAITVNIRNIHFLGSGTTAGVFTMGNPTVIIDSCTFTRFNAAVRLAASAFSQIRDCSFDSNAIGVVLSYSSSYDCNASVITRNRFSRHTDCAIDMEHTGGLHKDNTITGNIFVQNQQCIRMITSLHTVITGNSFSETIKEPIIMSVCMGGGNNNIIHHNAFVSGTIHSTDWAGRLYYHWYDSTARQGNYWADYTGRDADGDGVGETPYLIGGQGGNIDSFPLIRNPCISQPVAVNRPTRSIASSSLEVTSIIIKPGHIIISTAKPVNGSYRIFDALGRVSEQGVLANQQQIVLHSTGEKVGYCEIRDGAHKAVSRLPYFFTNVMPGIPGW